jgi:hypothetical protein
VYKRGYQEAVVPSLITESAIDRQRAELQAVLQSRLFARSPALSNLLSYLCEKMFAGQGDKVKEYSIALEVFGRKDSFDQDNDSIVRVEANRLRKRLADYYAGEGAGHALRIVIPVGQYVPIFEQNGVALAAAVPLAEETASTARLASRLRWIALAAGICVLVGLMLVLMARNRARLGSAAASNRQTAVNAPHMPAYVSAEEIRILAGSNRSYADHSGKLWNPDTYSSGGTPVRSGVQHIWRTQDPTIYRTSRQGDFAYDIPLKPGTYELRLHFAETFYGPEEARGGGEGSRVMNVTANGRPLLTGFDVLADEGTGRTADVKVFTAVGPDADGVLHLRFSSGESGTAMLSGIEILPGSDSHMRPVRIVARDVPYYSNDSRWWSADSYFKGGQLRSSQKAALGTDDPDLYETERWGHFSYAIPVPPGKYSVVLHFIGRHLSDAEPTGSATGEEESGTPNAWIFDVFCNGKTIVRHLDLLSEAGEDHPLVRTISGLEPNPQGKLLLEFVPVTHYATVSAIEVVPQ